jgi:hypothetical protein
MTDHLLHLLHLPGTLNESRGRSMPIRPRKVLARVNLLPPASDLPAAILRVGVEDRNVATRSKAMRNYTRHLFIKGPLPNIGLQIGRIHAQLQRGRLRAIKRVERVGQRQIVVRPVRVDHLPKGFRFGGGAFGLNSLRS